MALTQKQIEWLAKMKQAQVEAEAKRLAQLAARTSEEIARAEEIRAQQIRTADRRSAPMKERQVQSIHLQDEE